MELEVIVEKYKKRCSWNLLIYESFPSYLGTSAKEWKCVVQYIRLCDYFKADFVVKKQWIYFDTYIHI